MSTSTCSSCGAPIEWVQTEKGKSMPLDAAPGPSAWVTFKRSGATIIKCVKTRVPHWGTCPNASQHKKEK